MLGRKILLMEIGEKIKKLRKDRELTQKKLAEKLGRLSGKKYIFQQIGFMENGTRPISLKELKILAEIFGVITNYLLDDSKPYPPSPTDRLLTKPLHHVTLIKESEEEYRNRVHIVAKVAANGTPEVAFSDDGFPIGETGESVVRPPGLSERAYAVIISGESLSPGIPDGSIVIADPTGGTTDWDRVKRGDTVIVRVRGLTYAKGLDMNG